MITRTVKLPKNLDFFLFGPRSTGKTTLLKEHFSGPNVCWIDLLKPDTFDRFQSASVFENFLSALPKSVDTIVIDEIQKLPLLLDVVQGFIQQERFRFALTSSSARKLKRGHANLLGGRAVVRKLWSLTHIEIGESHFKLESILHWGSLPKVFLSNDEQEKKDLLQSYIQTYLAEEVVAEQLVRNLIPFRKFLAVAAQMNGKIINASKIGADVGTDHNTVSHYFEILEDTLIGFSLPAFETSVRKRVRKKPKFFIFDLGVTRALTRMLDIPLHESTSPFGDVFEHFIISEIFKLCSYLKPDWELFYLASKDNAEIDLIIDRPGQKKVLIEIKSTQKIESVDLTSTLALMRDFGDADCLVLSRDPLPQKLSFARALPWKQGIAEIFEL